MAEVEGMTSPAGADAAREGGRWKVPAWAFPAALFAISFALYIPTFQYDFVNWDDQLNLVENAEYRGLSLENLKWMFSNFNLGHYQPITWITYAIDHSLWRLDPAGFHLTNVVFHAVNTVLFYFVVVALVGEHAPRGRLWAVFAALLFAVHPLRVEVVAWITARRDLVSTCFIFLSLLAYLRAQRATEPRPWRWLAVSAALYGCALLSKAVTITYPAVLIVLDWYPLRRWGRVSWKRLVLEKVPYVALAGGMTLIALLADKSSGAMRPLAEHGILARIAQASYGLCFYLWKTVWPANLSPLYPFKKIDPFEATFVASAILVVAITAGLFLARRRAPWAWASWLIYAVIVSPVSGLVQSGVQITADRYTYQSCLPWALLAGMALSRLGNGRSGAFRAVVSGGAAAVLVSLAVLAAKQSEVWRHGLTLWEHAVSIFPDSAQALSNRGIAKIEQNRFREALADFEEAIRLRPRYDPGYEGRSAVRYALGDFKGALEDLNKIFEMSPAVPPGMLARRGRARLAVGDRKGAFEDFDKCIERSNRPELGYFNRGLGKQQVGDYAGAIADFTEAIRIAPAQADYAYCERGFLRRLMGDLQGAMSDFQQALFINPRMGRAYRHRAVARMALKDYPGALSDFDRAIVYEPNLAETHNHRGVVRCQLGNIDAGIEDFDRALELQPTYADALVNRGSALQAKQDVKGAMRDFSRALETAPWDWPNRLQVQKALEQLRRAYLLDERK